MSAPQTKVLRLEVADGIATVTFDTPDSRANTMGQAVVAEWDALVKDLAGRKDVQGLILQSGKPGMFIAGADLRELGSIKAGDPSQTRELVRRGLTMIAGIEALPFPTVALIDGACMGGGLELALGFDFRLAGSHPKCEMGLPEVKVGLFPGWGGTQRLTRLVGPSLAAELICAGDAVKADRAKELGIVFDAVPSDRLHAEGVRLLKWARESKAWEDARKKKRQPVGLSEEQLSFAYIVAKTQVAAKTKGQLPAPVAACDAIFKGANLPLEDGLKIETDLFVPIIGSPVARNLIAVFFMTQRLGKDPGVSDAKLQPKNVERVGVVGAGIMGAGIAGAHARRGIPTLLTDSNAAAIQKGVAAITKSVEDRIKIGRAKPADMVSALGNLSAVGSLTAFADRDVVVEAVVENEQVKVALYAELQKVIGPEAILASNTSTISITRMGQSVSNPGRFAGLHFFNPVDRMQLVEVIRGTQTSDQTVVTLVALSKKIGKTPIVVKDCPGFLVNRILFPYINEALVLLEEGAGPREIDKAATAFGMPMGPITLNDVVGNDTALYAGRVVNTAFAERAQSSKILDDLVAAGRLGQKTGAGFYSYAKGSRGADDPAFAELLAKHRKNPRPIPQEEIIDRLFLPMLTEASRILAEGIVREPGDVDMGLILGIGFPAWRGGLLRWADTVGLPEIIKKLEKYKPLGLRFAPTEQIQALAASGKGFYGEK